MAGDVDLFYWDACIFYEHLRGEQTDPRKKQAIDDLLKENKDKRNRICTSVITHIEVLPKKLVDQAKEDEYWSRFGSMHFFDIETDRQVMMLARDIKNYYFKPAQPQPPGAPPANDKMLSTGDAVHLATAIIHKAKEFWTRDKSPKHGNIKLLGLPESSPSGKICGVHELRIVDPETRQPRFAGT